MRVAAEAARVSRVAALVGLLWLPSGCHRSESPASPTLVVAQQAEPASFNPAITTSGNVHPVTDQVFSGLVELDENLQPVPELAESWDVSPDGRTVTFRLRQDVRWHDGERFTAADVKFSFEEALLKYHARTRAGLADVLERIDAPEPYVAIFRLRRRHAPLLRRLDVVEASIIPRHRYAGQDVLTADANLHPIGTGPFRFVVNARGDRVELARNPDYFRRGVPAFDRLVFRSIPSGPTAVAALERGEIDLLFNVPATEIARLRQQPGIVVVATTGGSGGSNCQDTLVPNLTRAPLDRVEVRRAIAQAIDHGFIGERVYFGRGTPATGPVSRAMAWAYTDDVPRYPYDPAAARRALDAAGLRAGPDGTRARIRFTHYPAFARLGQALREQFARVGIALELDAMDFNAAVDRVYIKKDFDLGVSPFCNGADPDIGVRRVYVSNTIGPVPFSNGAMYSNPRIDQLFEAAATAAGEEERRALYHQIQRELVADVPYFWIQDTDNFRAHRAEWSGFRYWSGAFAETGRRAATP